MTDRIEAQIERFAPGFRDRVLARSVLPPKELERRNRTSSAATSTAAPRPLALLVARPVLAVVPYGTPAPRLYLAPSSTPPGGGVHGMCGYLARARRSERRLVGALLRLVGLERLGRVDVAERRMLRRDVLPARRSDAEPLAEDGDERARLHRPDTGEVEQAPLEVRPFSASVQTRAASPAYSLAIAAQSSCVARAIVAGEAVERRALAEGALEVGRIRRRRSRAASSVPRRRSSSSGPENAFCTVNLLVEDEADQERQRILGEERVRLVVAGEMEAVRPRCGHDSILVRLSSSRNGDPRSRSASD